MEVIWRPERSRARAHERDAARAASSASTTTPRSCASRPRSRSASGRRRSRTWGSSSHVRGTRCVDESRGPEWATWFVGGRLNLAWNCVHRWAHGDAGGRGRRGLAERRTQRRSLCVPASCRTRSRASRRRWPGSASSPATGWRSSCRCRRRWRSPRTRARTLARSRCRSSRASRRRRSPSGSSTPEAKVVVTADGSLRRGPRGADEGARRRGARGVAVGRARRRLAAARRRRCRCSRAATSSGTRPSPSRPASSSRSRSTPEHPYLLTYTSGTTGQPKGVLHVQGGFLVSITREVAYQADAQPGDVIHFVTDMGWIMGPWDGGRRRWRSAARSSSPRARPTGLRPTGSGGWSRRSASRCSGSRRR